MGKYVCHHAILTRDHGYYVGAKRFSTIGAVVDYFKAHPLGETFLKEEVRSYSKNYHLSSSQRKKDYFHEWLVKERLEMPQ